MASSWLFEYDLFSVCDGITTKGKVCTVTVNLGQQLLSRCTHAVCVNVWVCVCMGFVMCGCVWVL